MVASMVAINIQMSTLVNNKFSIYNLFGNFNLESELSRIIDFRVAVFFFESILGLMCFYFKFVCS